MINIWIASIADFIFGDPYSFPHPVRFIGSYINIFEKMVKKMCKSDTALKLAGILLTISTVFLSYVIVWGIIRLAFYLGQGVGYFISILIMYTCLAGRCLDKEGTKIMAALESKDVKRARKLLSYIVGRDTDNLDESEIARAVIETVAENTSDGIIAPLFYMFLGGAPLAMAYKAINTLDSMVGYKNDKYMYFGWASARLDDIANYIPARLSALFMIIGSFLLGMDYMNSYRIVLRDGRNHISPNSGYPEAAAAGALGIRLGGGNYYFGKIVAKPTIGDKLKTLETGNIKQMAMLMYGSQCTALAIFSIVHYFLKGI
ncbi:MAG: adenosylcobinamide-phosphate synthase CbiB [Lutispora sp.]|nr:adenosylcobinamide-phosphate synthase CbiB [Lutispora sp.]MDD4835315.1 adenosylcobinamide-phosphate synthase CbiB [Lutispora sp.]